MQHQTSRTALLVSSFPSVAFDPAVPIGTITVIDNDDPHVVTDLIRVPSGWILRTFIQREGTLEGWDGAAQSFIPIPDDCGRG